MNVVNSDDNKQINKLRFTFADDEIPSEEEGETEETCPDDCEVISEFTLSIDESCSNLDCDFTVNSNILKKDIDYIEWNFGEGAASYAAGVGDTKYSTSWIYSDYGTYVVTLNLIDKNDNSDTATKIVTIETSAPKILWEFRFITNGFKTSKAYEYSSNVTADASATTSPNLPLDFHWELWDKEKSVLINEYNEAIGSAIFNNMNWAGRQKIVYELELEVKDSEGLESTKAQEMELYPNTLQWPKLHVYPENPCVGEPVYFWVTNMEDGCLRDPEGDKTHYRVTDFDFNDPNVGGGALKWLKDFGTNCFEPIPVTEYTYNNIGMKLVTVKTMDYTDVFNWQGGGHIPHIRQTAYQLIVLPPPNCGDQGTPAPEEYPSDSGPEFVEPDDYYEQYWEDYIDWF